MRLWSWKRLNCIALLSSRGVAFEVPKMSFSLSEKRPSVAIVGCGVIGSSLAYYLAKDHGIGATVVDREGVAAAASGRAGGFLARDWNDGSGTEKLTHASFDLHADLGRDLRDTDYRRLRCEAVAIEARGKPSNKKLETIEWPDASRVAGHRSLGKEDTIAQVHPYKLCHALMDAAKEMAGTTFLEATVKNLLFDDGNKKIEGLRVISDSDEERILRADVVVITMGPWTHVCGLSESQRQCDLEGWGLDLPSIVGTKYHAVLLQSPEVLSTAVFFQGLGDPEVYPRPDGEVYVTGFPDAPRVVDDLPGQTEVLDSVCNRLKSTIESLAPGLRGAPVNKQQACHLPSAPDGLPLIGPVPGRDGAFVATGHGCWGVLLAPATGKALAELIVHGKSSTVNLAPFHPSRFLRR